MFKFIALVAILSVSMVTVAYASPYKAPYKSYSYDYWSESVQAPTPYKPMERVSGDALNVGAFSNPTDFYVRDDTVYVLDAGNARIVAFERKGGEGSEKVKLLVESYVKDGVETQFSAPGGIFVTRSGEIYVADTGNGRVVILDSNGQYVKSVENPRSDLLPDDFSFRPIQVAVDDAHRLYVIAKDVFEGIMCFNDKGEFYGYYGTIKVEFNPLDWFWRQISTKAQRAALRLFIPTEFSALDIDDDGFVYATNVDKYGTGNAVKRLNPSGADVLTNFSKNVKIIGDPNMPTREKSILRDVKYRGYGIYSVMDVTVGKIFTYDSEGNFLYVFGGIGSVDGLAKKPSAIECLSDGTFLLLDGERGDVIFFDETEYGRLINTATRLRYNGDEEGAVNIWKQVLDLDANYQLAYVGIGKSYLAADENKIAMEYLKKGMDVNYYSVAFKRHRNDVLRQSLPAILTVGIAAVGVILVIKIFRRGRRAINDGYIE